MFKSISKLCVAVALTASVSACAMYNDMYDSDMHHAMMKKGTIDRNSMGKYDYPPYYKQCPADYRMKGWC